MGVRVIKYGLLVFFFSSCTTIKQKKENYESFKEIAFCTCLIENYSEVDSLFVPTYMDVSKSVIFSGRPLSPKINDSIVNYTIENTANIYMYDSHTTDQVGGNSNFISLSCLEYYNSIELKRYIKGKMKENK